MVQNKDFFKYLKLPIPSLPSESETLNNSKLCMSKTLFFQFFFVCCFGRVGLHMLLLLFHTIPELHPINGCQQHNS